MKQAAVIVMVIFSIHFWGYVGVNPGYYKYTNLLSLGVMAYCMVVTNGQTRQRFRGAIILYLIGILANILSAYFNNGQGLRDTTFSFFNYYFIILYFFLHYNRISVKEFENIIIAFAILYSLFYLRQEQMFPYRLFYGNMFADRGTIRIRIEGNGFHMLAYFLMLNRFLLKRNIIHLILALFFFFILIKSGFRTLTAGAILMSGIMFMIMLKYSVYNYFMVVLALGMFVGLLQLESVSTIIDNMISATEEQQQMGEEYIRHLQYEYFTNIYPKNFTYYIVGGGLPGASGSYAMQMGSLIESYGFYWVDLGLIGFYYVIGLVAMLGMLGYTLKAVFTKLPVEGLYLRIYMGYLVIVSVTTMEIFRPGIFAVAAIVLYIIDRKRDEMEKKTVEPKKESS